MKQVDVPPCLETALIICDTSGGLDPPVEQQYTVPEEQIGVLSLWADTDIEVGTHDQAIIDRIYRALTE